MGQDLQNGGGVCKISNSFPSKVSIVSNAHALQDNNCFSSRVWNGSIVEPEVLMDGDHSAKVCFKKTSEVIKKCFEELIIHKVDLTGVILKPNMILDGSSSR